LPDFARRLTKAEQFLASGGRGPFQLICICGGIPTDSGGPEAEIAGNALVPEPGEDLEEFQARVSAEARRLGFRFAVIRGLPTRAERDDWL
jgi:hypothetical protein